MLDAGRDRLCIQFSVQEIVEMVDCYRGYVFTVDRFSMMAPDLCDNLNIRFSDYRSSKHGRFIHRLKKLDLFPKIALADALEQLWSHGATGKAEIAEYFGEIGILLRG